ncbi:bifunctional oligoribonuclease/PAP phosphatase NrnA [Enterococcus hirae]|nr:bifunctional oligoribonuclease/PAP phosphatase NrnA [Enterococcus hirae]
MSIQSEILEEIKAHPVIIIHRHKRPDPDAIGSQVGLAEMLRASFPEKEIYQVGGPVEGLEFMAAMQEIPDEKYQGALVIATDTANAPRISDDRYQLGEMLIKIDHHPDNEPYGDLSWVQAGASSTSELIATFQRMFPETLKLNRASARLLYGGIVGDTGRFLYPATAPSTHEIAAYLMYQGFDAAQLNRELEQIPLGVAKLYGYIFEHLEVDGNGAAKVILPLTVLKANHVVDSEISPVVPLPGIVDSVVSWAIFVEQPEGYYRVRLRSKGPHVNVIAQKYHGGGHDLASGANVYNETEINTLYQELQETVARYKAK